MRLRRIPPARVVNLTGYDTSDLEAFTDRALRACGAAGRVREIVYVASPIRSRGCADVGGERMVIAIAPPSRFRFRRLALLLRHECRHILGDEHEDMPEDVLYSEGPIPLWVKGLRLRYRGRAPDQMAHLRSPRGA